MKKYMKIQMKNYIPLKHMSRTVIVSVCFPDCKMSLSAGGVFGSSSGLLLSCVISSIIVTVLQDNSWPFLLSNSF